MSRHRLESSEARLMLLMRHSTERFLCGMAEDFSKTTPSLEPHILTNVMAAKGKAPRPPDHA